MNSDSPQQPEFSSWWFTGFLTTFASLIGLLVAANAGEIRTFALFYLMGLFVVCGAMLSTLIVNAVGLGKKWELAKQNSEEEMEPVKRADQRSLLARLSERRTVQDRFVEDPEPRASFSFAEESADVPVETESNTFMSRRRQPRRRA